MIVLCIVCYDSVPITGVSWLLIAGLLGIVACAACGAMRGTRVEVEERMPEPRRSTRRGRGRNPRLCCC